MTKIFFDNNATTQIDPRVAHAISDEWQKGPSNPSSIHTFGQEAKRRLSRARETIANTLSAKPSEITFTSGGTEGLNLMIFSLPKNTRIITSPIEHPAVYEAIRSLGNPKTYLPVGSSGSVIVSDVKEAIGESPCAIVLSAVNSETGVKNPIDAIAQMAKENAIPLLVDGVGLLGKETFTVHPGVSAVAFSGHKFHGPQGTGFVLCRSPFRLEPRLFGGGQESLRRSGTENLPGIVGLAKAVELLEEELPGATTYMQTLRDRFESGLKELIPNIQINGENRVANTSNVTFPGMDGESLLIELDLKGVAASMGSACSSGALEPSRVLTQMGLSREEALSSLRFSFSRFNTLDEIAIALEIFEKMSLLHIQK